jgi:hypothetical protein
MYNLVGKIQFFTTLLFYGPISKKVNYRKLGFKKKFSRKKYVEIVFSKIVCLTIGA